jgi:hypothetical protein
MAASAGFIGKGVTLGYSTTLAGTYTDVAELLSVAKPKVTTDRVEFTHSTSDDDFKEFKPGWKEGENTTFTVNATDAGLTALVALEGLQRFWKITLPNTGASTFAWQGTLQGIDMPVDIKDRVVLTIELTCDGAITYAA